MVLIEVLGRVNTVSRELLAVLLPHVLAAVRSQQPEFQTAGYMIVGEICTRAVLSAELSSVLVESIASRAQDATVNEALACLIYIMQTQPMTEFPEKAFKFVVKFRFVECCF